MGISLPQLAHFLIKLFGVSKDLVSLLPHISHMPNIHVGKPNNIGMSPKGPIIPPKGIEANPTIAIRTYFFYLFGVGLYVVRIYEEGLLLWDRLHLTREVEKMDNCLKRNQRRIVN